MDIYVSRMRGQPDVTTPSRQLLLLIAAVLTQPLALGTAAAQRLTGELPNSVRITTTLDSLEHVVLTAANPSARVSAALMIADAGRRQAAVGPDETEPLHPRDRGVVARLATIYRKSTDPTVRIVIVQWMPALVERPRAIAFLVEVAREAPVPNSRRPSRASRLRHHTAISRAEAAIYALTRMGAEGRAALARLDVSGTVRDPEARAYLARLAKEGYENRE